MGWTLVLGVAFLTGNLSAQETKQEKKEEKKVSIAGQWKVVSGMRAGDEVSEDRLPPEVEITAKKLTMPVPEGDPFVMVYKIDASKKPMEINIEIESGPAPEGKALGIIKMEKGKLMLCYDPMGENRPKKFKTSEDDGFFMFTMEKIEDDKKKKDK